MMTAGIILNQLQSKDYLHGNACWLSNSKTISRPFYYVREFMRLLTPKLFLLLCIIKLTQNQLTHIIITGCITGIKAITGIKGTRTAPSMSPGISLPDSFVLSLRKHDGRNLLEVKSKGHITGGDPGALWVKWAVMSPVVIHVGVVCVCVRT